MKRTLFVLASILIVLAFIVGCSPTPSPGPSTQPVITPADSQATSLTAFAITVGGLQAAPEADRAKIGAEAYQIAGMVSTAAGSGQINTVSLKQLVAAQVAKDAKLAPYAVPINAAASLLIDGIAAKVSTSSDPRFAAYVQAACMGVQQATAGYVKP